MTNDNPYDKRYDRTDLYWGEKPSSLCERVMEFVDVPEEESRRLRLLDLGCGEGRNALFFARNGFDVVGLDLSKTGLEKLSRLASAAQLAIETIHADIISYEVENSFDLLFSTGSLHYLPPEVRKQKFDNYKAATPTGGIHAMAVFVEKPFIDPAPDAEESAFLYRSGELMSYYHDWEILFSEEMIFDCISSGVAHRHAVNRVIARRPPSWVLPDASI